MKIYNRTEFMKLPEWTFYIKSSGDYNFNDIISIKGKTILDSRDRPIDWVHLDLNCFGDESSYKEDIMLSNDIGFPLTDLWARDGCFDHDEVFLVYERDDLVLLRYWIDMGLSV